MKKEHFLNKDMKNTMLKMYILRETAKSDVNSYSLLKQFTAKKRFAKAFSNPAEIKNEIYNTIKSLEKSGYIKSTQKIENGRLKNYYTLTKDGVKILKSAKDIFKEHIKELTSLLNG
jgi:DNA-binding PadR family transcriptional regulator